MSNKKKSSGSTAAGATGAPNRRELLRQQQEAEAKRARTMRMVLIGALVLALALIGLVGSQLYKKHSDNTAAAATQTTPPDANADKSGIVLDKGTKLAAGAPTLVVYQDYQCPACKQYEDQLGDFTNSLAAAGKIGVEYRTMTFLDTNLRNDSSIRSGRAAACADNVSSEAYRKYHDVVYAHQPTQEGEGYTDQQLRVDFAGEAGITGADLTKFQACYDSKATESFVKGTDQKASEAKVTSTPTYRVNGKDIDFKTAGVPTTEAGLLDLINKTAAA